MRVKEHGRSVLIAASPGEAAWIAAALKRDVERSGVDDLGETERAFLANASREMRQVAVGMVPALLKMLQTAG